MSWLVVLGDALILVGLIVLTLSLLGTWRFPDVHTRLHATTKGSSLGVMAILLATVATRDVAMLAMASLVGFFLVLTAPVATHAIARAKWRRDGEDA